VKYIRETPEYRAYKRALFNDLFWWRGRQLTTGSDDYPPVCSCFHNDQPYLRPAPVELYGRAPACMCRYGLRYVAGVTGMFELDPFRKGWHRGVYAFKIHPKCPHHGDASFVWAGTTVDCAYLERRGD
jgi:hypothetical protein